MPRRRQEIDAGPALQPLFAYTSDEIEDMVHGSSIALQWAPLLGFIGLQTDCLRRRRAACAEVETDKSAEKLETRPLLE